MYVKTFPASYGNQRSIIGLTIRHLSLSCARSIRSTPSYSIPSIFILILYLPSTPSSSKWALSFMFPQQNPICMSPLPIHATYRLTRFMTHQVKRTHAVPKVKVKSSSSSSNICHGDGPLVDPFRSHASRSLFKGLPWFLLPVGE